MEQKIEKWSDLVRYQLGHDSEFFLEDPSGKVVPSYAFFKMKEEETTFYVKHPSVNDALGVDPGEEWKRLFAVWPLHTRSVKAFRDGLAVEFNTEPATCRGYLLNHLTYSLVAAGTRLPEGVKFTSKPVMEVTKALVDTFPEDLKVLGCSPTLDAYTGGLKELKVNPLTLPFRTSGSHLHMSFTSNIPVHLWAPFIKMADFFIGVPFAYIFHEADEFKRRTLYGTAGEFRRQIYPSGLQGLEYRTLSSRLWDHPMTASLFLGIWKYIMGNPLFVHEFSQRWDPAWEEDIQAGINLGDENALKRMMRVMAENFPGYFNYNPTTTEARYWTIYDKNYQLRWLGGASYSLDSRLKVWAGLREWRKMGNLPELSTLNPTVPEGHFGWQHYSTLSNFREVVNGARL